MPCAKEQTWVLFLVVFLLALGSRYGHGQGDADLAKQSQNPISDLISLPLQNNTNFYQGPQEGTGNVLNIQPVVPFSMGANWNLITRTIFPIISLPEVEPDGPRSNILGDTVWEIPSLRLFSLPRSVKWFGASDLPFQFRREHQQNK